MHIVPITQWGSIEAGQAADYQVFAFTDIKTIQRSVVSLRQHSVTS